MIQKIKVLAAFFILQGTAGLVVAAEPVIERVISAGGAVSEWVVALGGEQQLVGVEIGRAHV